MAQSWQPKRHGLKLIQLAFRDNRRNESSDCLLPRNGRGRWLQHFRTSIQSVLMLIILFLHQYKSNCISKLLFTLHSSVWSRPNKRLKTLSIDNSLRTLPTLASSSLLWANHQKQFPHQQYINSCIYRAATQITNRGISDEAPTQLPTALSRAWSLLRPSYEKANKCR